MRYSRGDDAVLCCCEYYNNDGERSHLLGLLCDCAEVDDAFDRMIRGEKWHQQQLKKICSVLHDRCRFPWRGGAKRIPLDIISPVLLVPSLLWLSSLNLVAFVITNLIVMPLICWVIYKSCLREFNPRTKFFFSWSVCTTVYLIYVYEYHVVGFFNLQKIISPLENFFLVTFIVTAAGFFYDTKRRAVNHFCKEGVVDDKKVIRFCRVCQGHVIGKDHHCVWIDECISATNFSSFILFLLFVLAALVHGGLLLLTSVCESSSPLFSILIPRKCDNFNQNFFGDPALTFAAGCHCFFIAALVFLLLAIKTFQLTYERFQK